MPKPAHVRFLKNIRIDGDHWIWTGSIHPCGAGHFTARTAHNITNRQVLAHVWSFKWYKGPVPSTHCVKQNCGLKLCVHPKHLYLESKTDYVKRAWANGSYAGRRKSRFSRKGAANPNAKLNIAKVMEIRCRPYNIEAIKAGAKEFGICPTQFMRIHRGLSWNIFANPPLFRRKNENS